MCNWAAASDLDTIERYSGRRAALKSAFTGGKSGKDACTAFGGHISSWAGRRTAWYTDGWSKVTSPA
jgi:hypothetical protein